MPDRRCTIAIIGAGTAGLHAWEAADRAGADMVVIERGDGGSLCTATGCIPSKLLIAAGRAAWEARHAGRFGIGTGAVTVDGPAVMQRLRRLRDQANGKIADKYRAIAPEHRLHGEARFTGPTTLQVGDTTVEADAIIVATGSTPQVPAALEPVKALVKTNEDIFELEQIPASLAVVGAGPLGLELAQAFARLGTAVTVLGGSGTLGAIGDPEAEAAARAALGREMAIHTGVEISAAPADGKARLSWTGETTGSVEVEVELVLAATGRTPAVEALDLKAAGIPLDEHGSPTDVDEATRRCGDTAVFIAGDAGNWRPVLHEAARGGRIAAEVAAGKPASRPLPSLAIAFTEPNIVEVGARFGDLPDDALIGTYRADDNIRTQIDGHDDGLVRLYAAADGTILGATLILTGAEHLGQTLALAIDAGMDAARLFDQAWYHPVIEEMVQQAALDLCRRLA